MEQIPRALRDLHTAGVELRTLARVHMHSEFGAGGEPEPRSRAEELLVCEDLSPDSSRRHNHCQLPLESCHRRHVGLLGKAAFSSGL